ncbi:prenyltransferase [Mycobacterium marinum]|uniref:prenyltransferase n=1 Tax=Mycobacterium marinum TaxID=1781 RepID=UPI000E3D6DBA|nr:prenyltransferase [Mycobacterium marinum]MDC8974410.1 prenyltransferase [Mycobacterium marinum]MDC8983151.1 prenyltransferase [Mycobacterium marinum]MDC8994432.1 prenyltransferase [Mycobacterium marinum]MDC9000056.1 prenyltransferase [Mycobacterium marinum]MDC9010439.1 prenyltransferase [Mycobacterium marinum]
MHRPSPPAVPGALTRDQCRQTAQSIASAQEPSGAIPWFVGGHTDPWDHVECAMALTAAGLLEQARAAFDWSRRAQRADGSWPIQIRTGTVEDENSDSNFCAYIATGIWHHVLVTGDKSFAVTMWPVVRKAIDFVIDLQVGNGEICWARSDSGPLTEALMTGCASIFHAMRCALALAAFVGEPQPEWELALGRLGHAIVAHPEAFAEKERYSMDWYYPILGGALRGPAAAARIDHRWNDFVVGGLGIRCVDDRPWVTGAETCELVLALDAIGHRAAAHEQFAAMQHLREDDGSYWTGLVFADGKRWPEERTTWTAAAMILAADALSNTTRGAGIFRGHALPTGLQTDFDCECVVSRPGR